MLVKDIFEGVDNDSLRLSSSKHGVGFARGCLSVHEDGGMLCLKELLYYLPATSGIDVLVWVVTLKGVIAGEFIYVVLFHFALAAECFLAHDA